MDIKDAWTLVHEAFKEQRALEKKRRQFQTFTRHNLNYTILEDMHNSAARQAPGFYSRITFPDGTVYEFGVKPKLEKSDTY